MNSGGIVADELFTLLNSSRGGGAACCVDVLSIAHCHLEKMQMRALP